MSQANVNLVRRIFADWDRGDFSSAGWADPEVELVLVDGPQPGAWRGVEAMGAAMGEFLSAWEHMRVRADEYLVLDDERVLVLVRWTGRGRTSGLDLRRTEAKAASLFQIRRGKVIKLLATFDRERALVDAGLRPR